MANHFRERPRENDLQQEQEELRQRQEAERLAREAVAAGEPQKKGRKTRLLNNVLGGEVLKGRGVMRLLPLMVMILLYAIVLVAARYRVESLMKEKMRMERELEFMRDRKSVV